jgi:hypothetical protein
VDSKTSAKRFLALYFIIFFGAVFLRVDYFPLSWVPMYGHRQLDDQLTVKFGDLSVRRRGFAAERANGEKLFVSNEDLNIPPGHFRRMFHQRAFNAGPPQDDRERLELMAFNRWWYETLVGPDPRLHKTYSRQVLTSVNRTFGYGPDDPRRIVRLEAPLEFATFSRSDLASGDLRRPQVQLRTAIITESGSFVRIGDSLQPMDEGLRANAGVLE